MYMKWLALGLTLLMIILLVWNLHISYQLKAKVDRLQATNVGYPVKKLDNMHAKITLIDRILSTMPIAIIGDGYGPTQADR